MRLTDYGHNVGLIKEDRYKRFITKKENINELTEVLKNNKITPTKEVNATLEKYGTTPLKDGITLYDLLKRPEVNYDCIENFIELNYNPYLDDEDFYQEESEVGSLK